MLTVSGLGFPSTYGLGDFELGKIDRAIPKTSMGRRRISHVDGPT